MKEKKEVYRQKEEHIEGLAVQKQTSGLGCLPLLIWLSFLRSQLKKRMFSLPHAYYVIVFCLFFCSFSCFVS